MTVRSIVEFLTHGKIKLVPAEGTVGDVAEKMGTTKTVVLRIEKGADVFVSELQLYAMALGYDLTLTVSRLEGRR